MIEGGTEFVQLFLSNSFAVSCQDLVLNFIDCSKIFKLSNLSNIYAIKIFFSGVFLIEMWMKSHTHSRHGHFSWPVRSQPSGDSWDTCLEPGKAPRQVSYNSPCAGPCYSPGSIHSYHLHQYDTDNNAASSSLAPPIHQPHVWIFTTIRKVAVVVGVVGGLFL